MGACSSKPPRTKDDTAAAKPPTAQVNGSAQPPPAASPPVANAAPPDVSRAAPGAAPADAGLDRNQSLGTSRWSRNGSLQSEPSRQGATSPPGVYVPSSGFKTAELAQRMVEKYEMPPEEVKRAIDFAESEEYVDVYCFTYCITGGPMEPTAFKVAGLQGMDKEAILQWATAPGNEDVRALTSAEQARHKRARDAFLVSQQTQAAAELEAPEDIEELTEAYRLRFEADTEAMSLEQVLEYFGVPELSKVAIHKHLHPARGSATATIDEIARRKAAHPIALERFDALS